jgi:protein TonB
MDNKFVLSESFNDIVFEKRNKKYGAYEIRRTYGRYMLIAGAAATIFLTSATFTWAYVASGEDVPRVIIEQVDLSDMRDYGGKDVPPVPVKPKLDVFNPPAQGPKTAAMTSDVDIVDDTPELPPSNIPAGLDPNGVPGGTGTPTPNPGDCLDCPLLDSVAVVPEMKIVEWAMFPPTCDGLDDHIRKNVRYPDLCREMGIEGTVYVEFIVDSRGGYRDVKVLQGPHPALNKEALRVMSIMPSWTPAKDEHGNIVEYIMRKPIRFTLSR